MHRLFNIFAPFVLFSTFSVFLLFFVLYIKDINIKFDIICSPTIPMYSLCHVKILTISLDMLNLEMDKQLIWF